MNLTLLIDLDDTLLDNKMENFIPAYLESLRKPFAPYIDSMNLGPVMINAVEKMLHNDNSDRSLKETFDLAFYPPLGVTEDQVSEDLDHFYLKVFPKLKNVTQSRPEALKLIETATQRSWNIAIATNPLFPLAAILHRLTWAGVPAEKFSYAMVPSYETFHYAKPTPAFYAELLGRFGWPREPVLMVGNDPINDIQAAQLMGIPTFWISNGLPYPEGLPFPNASGSLEDIIPWLDSTPEEDLCPDYSTPSAITGTMRAIPSILLVQTADLTEEIWKLRLGADQWSLTEIACHLRDVEREINLPRLQKITSEDTPFIPGVDSDAWAVEREYQSQDGLSALRDFVTSRKQTMDLLLGLSIEDWQRAVQHAIFGPTSLREIATFIAGHDRLHIRQVHAILNK